MYSDGVVRSDWLWFDTTLIAGCSSRISNPERTPNCFQVEQRPVTIPSGPCILKEQLTCFVSALDSGYFRIRCRSDSIVALLIT